MNITLTPDTYAPSMNNTGEYVDYTPIILHGIYCPCGSRKEKVYETNSKFHTHTKTKKHQKWLDIMNQNKSNYYIESIKQKELVENQRKIIFDLELQLKTKNLTVDYLTKQLINVSKPEITYDLLDIN
jgi:hypothetical protein